MLFVYNQTCLPQRPLLGVEKGEKLVLITIKKFVVLVLVIMCLAPSLAMSEPTKLIMGSKPEIGSEFLHRLNQRKPEKFAYKVDYVSLYLTAKAVESCIDLQRRGMVVVKGTERHAIALNV